MARFELNKAVASHYDTFKKDSLALMSLITDKRVVECQQKRLAILETRKQSTEDVISRNLEWKRKVGSSDQKFISWCDQLSRLDKQAHCVIWLQILQCFKTIDGFDRAIEARKRKNKRDIKLQIIRRFIMPLKKRIPKNAKEGAILNSHQ